MENPTLPDEASPLFWTVIVGGILVWWLWPSLDLKMFDRVSEKPYSLSLRSEPCNDEGAVSAVQSALEGDDTPSTLEGAEVAEQSAVIDFNPEAAFEAAFEEAVFFVRAALSAAPGSTGFTKATAALHRTGEVIDRILCAWGSAEHARVVRLREDTEAFRCSFGRHRPGDACRGLLTLAGFERRTQPSGEVTWEFADNAKAKFRAMTVRLCLRKQGDLSRVRGTAVWARETNEDVIPNLRNACVAELFDVSRTFGEIVQLPTHTTVRERNVEVNTRIELNSRRSVGGGPALALHEGLVNAARALAYEQRTQLRTGSGNTTSAADVRNMLKRFPLPPGFSATHFHSIIDDLPHMFGLESARCGSRGVDDRPAEILALDAVGTWVARQPDDVMWASAAMCGVGAALDYNQESGCHRRHRRGL